MASQDFSLRISDSFDVDSAQENIAVRTTGMRKNDSVIVISDSSSESSPELIAKKQLEPTSWRSQKNNYKSPTYALDRYHLEYTDTDRDSSPDEENDRIYTTARSVENKKCDNRFNNLKSTKPDVYSNKIVLSSSDETFFDEDNNCDQKNVSSKPSSTCVNPIRQFLSHVPEKTDSYDKRIRHCQKQFNYLSSSSSSSSDSAQSHPDKASSKKPNSLKRVLTKEDVHKIFKNIRSTKYTYESPLQKNKERIIINESVDDDIHPAVDNDQYVKAKIKSGIRIGNKPISNNENDIEFVPNSVEIFPKEVRTPVNRIINTAKEKTDVALSERKKKEISQWILTNSPDSISDSSCSHVPVSNRNSRSSGESSLERLEMNYETPNNRGQIPKQKTAEKSITKKKIQDGCKSIVKQATLNKFLQNATQKVPEVTPNRTKGKQATTSVNTPTNINIMDCASILDKLYGTEWRQRTNKLLPVTEPRKQNIMKKDRAVQTERKKITKKINSSSDSEDECFNKINKKIDPNVKSAKKQQVVRRKATDSFINDEASSESANESIYYTALTNTEDKQPPTPKPVSALTKRVIEICDSDTDEEPSKEYNKFTKNIGRRRLSFSDDDEGSITSEFDPGEIVPPKVIPKKNNEIGKESSKTPRGLNQTPARVERPIINNPRIETHKSFLASLSESVPLSEAHPQAKKYRLDFKNTKEELCKRLFKLYNEKIFDKKLPEDTSIEWNVRMRGTAGFCYNKRSLKTLSGITKSSRIVLATKILDTPDRLRDTLVHELCHAAAWLINDVSDGHGPFWKGWASKAMRAFPDLPPIRRCHDYKIKTKFTYKCTGCGYSIGRHSKSLDTQRKRCGYCYGKFELLVNRTTKAGVVQIQTPRKEVSGFALFVKENYSSVKKERNAKHAEVMKILGQQFSALKIVNKRTDAAENNAETSF